MITSNPGSRASSAAEHRGRSVVADGEQAVVRVQDDGLALANLAAADHRVADRFGDLERLDGPSGERHHLGVGGGVAIGIEGQKGRETLGRVSSGHYSDAAGSHLARLPCREDDVRVVRQQQDLVGGDPLDRVEQLARRRVGALSAPNDRGDAVGVEDAGQSVACRHGDHGERHRLDDGRVAGRRGCQIRRCRLTWLGTGGRRLGYGADLDAVRLEVHMRQRPGLAPVCGQTMVDRRGHGLGGVLLADLVRLSVQVLDGDAGQRAERQAQGDHPVRPIVVDVDLDRARVAGDEHRLTEPLELAA